MRFFKVLLVLFLLGNQATAVEFYLSHTDMPKSCIPKIQNVFPNNSKDIVNASQDQYFKEKLDLMFFYYLISYDYSPEGFRGAVKIDDVFCENIAPVTKDKAIGYNSSGEALEIRILEDDLQILKGFDGKIYIKGQARGSIYSMHRTPYCYLDLKIEIDEATCKPKNHQILDYKIRESRGGSLF